MQGRASVERILVLCSLLFTAGACGDDDEEPIVPADAGVDGAAPADAAPGADAPPMAAAPVISSVSWMQAPGCTAGVRSNVTITVNVTDQDTAAGSLTFSGPVSGCQNLGAPGDTATIDGNPMTISCPQVASYPGTVTVMDPQGNSDTQAFTIGVCQDGSAP